MIDLDRWQEIYTTLKHHKLRTALSAFGVFWGIFMLVILLGAGKGLERGVLSNFGGHVNTIFIWSSGKTQMPYKGLSPGRWIPLKDGDLEMVRSLPDVDLISGSNRLGGWQVSQFIVRGQKTGSFSVNGIEPDAFKLAAYEAVKGRIINQLDLLERRKVAVIGSEVEEILFDKDENPVGQDIKIAGVNFLIIGTFKPRIESENRKRDAELILLPNSSLRHTFNQTRFIGDIQLSSKPGVSAEKLEKKIKALLKERHRVHPDESGVFGSWNAQKEFDKVQGLFSGIRNFSWVVAIGTVIAGVVGVGNIMLIIIKERTREIGIRKALGATSHNIVLTVMQESLVLTFVSGYFGLTFGVLALEGINKLTNNAKGIAFGYAEIDLTTAFAALTVLIIAGLLASVLPARKAAGVDPIVALQDE